MALRRVVVGIVEHMTNSKNATILSEMEAIGKKARMERDRRHMSKSEPESRGISEPESGAE